jgi:putative nucleotidyltransferase with HDIG domain
VLYPVFQKRRGHPTLISSRLFPEILTGDGAGGLRALLAEHDSEAQELAVIDEGILIDLDTQADYLKANLLRQRELPSMAECGEILNEMQVSPYVLSHCTRVAEVAETLASRLNDAGLHLNVALVKAAALLHDLAKGNPEHAQLGARILEDMGFGAVARIVGLHMDYEGSALDEAAIVYLADKMVQGDRIVSLAQRFERKFAIAANNGTLPFVQRRWDSTQRIAEAVERTLGLKLRQIISQQDDLRGVS